MLFGIVVLIFASAFFSGSETAYSSVNTLRLKLLSKQGDKKAGVALSLVSDFDALLSTILVGNTAVNVVLSSLTTVYVTEVYGEEYVAVATVVLTFAILVLGEKLPKGLAKEFAEVVSLHSASMLCVLRWLFTPVCFILAQIQGLLPKATEKPMSEEELKLIFDDVEQKGGCVDSGTGEILDNVVDSHDTVAREIMIHRTKMDIIDVSSSREEAESMFISTGRSRLVVVDGTSDNVVGILHQKAFHNKKSANIKDIMTRPVIAAGVMRIIDLLKEMRRQHAQVAIVVDEFGGTDGMLTVEDIVEELVGDIRDEFDEDEHDATKNSASVA